MKNTLKSTILAAVLLLSVCGCGSSETPETASTTATVSEAVTTISSEASETVIEVTVATDKEAEKTALLNQENFNTTCILDCPTDRKPENYTKFLDNACLPLESCDVNFDLLNTYNAEQYNNEALIPVADRTPVFAVQNGTVKLADFHDGYGYCVMLDHGDGITTIYAHLSDLFVTADDTVEAGEVIGITGTTGKATECGLGYTFQEN